MVDQIVWLRKTLKPEDPTTHPYAAQMDRDLLLFQAADIMSCKCLISFETTNWITRLASIGRMTEHDRRPS